MAIRAGSLVPFFMAIVLLWQPLMAAGSEQLIEWQHSVSLPLPAKSGGEVAWRLAESNSVRSGAPGLLSVRLPSAGIGKKAMESSSHREVGMEGWREMYWTLATWRFRVERIENTRATATRSLQISAWATADRPEWGESLFGFQIGTFALGSVPARSFISNVEGSNLPVSRPADGLYWITLALDEQSPSGEWQYVDFFTFRDRNNVGVPTCTPTSRNLCLNGGRFHAWARWTDFDGRSGVANTVSMTGDTGYFWFFQSSNVELVLKVLDGRGLNQKFWVFYGALSDVEYTLTVSDTLRGVTKRYKNPARRLASVADVDAFTESGAPGPSPSPNPGTGNLAFRLTWNGCADLDLYVQEPGGSLISFTSPTSASGGRLDVDSNSFCTSCATLPVENVFWQGTPPRGAFSFWAEHFACPTPQPATAFTLQVLRGGSVVNTHTGTLASGQRSASYRYTY